MSWQDTIPKESIASFVAVYRDLTKRAEHTSGLMFSYVFREHLSRPMSKGVRYPLSPESIQAIATARRDLLASRERLDLLFKLFRAWARAERKPPKRWVHGKEVLWEFPAPERQRLRAELFRSVKEIVALFTYKHTVAELVTLAALGDDASLMRLVELDKIFLTAKIAQKRIHQAQGMEDQVFFCGLSRAVRVDAYREHQSEAWLGVASCLLWFLGFERLPKIELYRFLEAKGAMTYKKDPESFKRMLTRIGLRRYRRGRGKVGHRGR